LKSGPMQPGRRNQGNDDQNLSAAGGHGGRVNGTAPDGKPIGAH
jgi:hypothetical protein